MVLIFLANGSFAPPSGCCLEAALELVETRFVCVMQHDRTFMRPFHDFLPLLKAMMADDDLKMVPWTVFLEWASGLTPLFQRMGRVRDLLKNVFFFFLTWVFQSFKCPKMLLLGSSPECQG